MSDKPAKLPTPEIERAAALLRDNGYIVTPPSGVRYGCFVDLEACEPGTKPDGCVIDVGRRRDCIYAAKLKCKEECGYWQAWTPESIAEFWEEVSKS